MAAFLAGRCGFMEVPRLIGDALDAHAGIAADDLDACLALDGAVRRTTEAALGAVPAGSALRLMGTRVRRSGRVLTLATRRGPPRRRLASAACCWAGRSTTS